MGYIKSSIIKYPTKKQKFIKNKTLNQYNMKKEKVKVDYLFEVSWEVCHQVGGIYTVIKSKAAKIYDAYRDNYFLIGPYYAEEAALKFDAKPIPKEFNKIFQELKKDNIICHFGKWTIDGVKVHTILIDFSKYMKKSGDIKRQLWDDFNVDSMNSKKEFDEWVTWSTISGRLLEGLRKTLKGRIVAQFHEYISGAGLLYLKKKKVKIGTVFTTHATHLGRTLTSSGVNLYDVLKKIKPKDEAYKHNIQGKYTLEKAIAMKADIFTTVSDITALEATHLIGRKPDLVLPNGLDMTKFPTMEERSIKHAKFKKQIMDFIKVFFFPYYRFDADNSLLYFIAGRYEFKNKGIDILIEALGNLNKKLANEENAKSIVVLLWIPTKVEGIDKNLAQNKINYEGVENFMDRSLGELKSNIINSIVNQKLPTTNELFSTSFHYQMKKKMFEFKQKGTPLMVTHNVLDKEDIILKSLKKAGLNNSSKDKVKVIYYPIYLTGADGLIDLSYYDAITGCHLGIFPSYYEPWGYTPLEAGALGVSSITTDLSGFGKYIMKKHPTCKGISVLKRQDISDKRATSNLTNMMYDFSKLSREDRIKRKLNAKHVADSADWANMVKYYIRAHNMALKKVR
jgi:glycogen(starch) synthase